MNMKRTANKFQRAYMVAKARVQEVESQQEAIEKKFIADKGIVNPTAPFPNSFTAWRMTRPLKRRTTNAPR